MYLHNVSDPISERHPISIYQDLICLRKNIW